MLANAFVLVVDDEKEMAKTMADTLRPHVAQVLVAHNGQEAWDKLLSKEGRDIDVVVCDLSMPVLSGKELFQRVRASGAQTPFVFLTGNSEKAEGVESLNLGHCTTLRKPEGSRALVEAIRNAMSTLKQGMRRAA